MSVMVQVPSIIIPWGGIGTEIIADAVTHPSITLPTSALQEKQALVMATMVGAPGVLNCWVEISPWGIPGTWVVLGLPAGLVATGSLPLPWTAHSSFARVVVQAPLWAAGSWVVVVAFEAKTP